MPEVLFGIRNTLQVNCSCEKMLVTAPYCTHFISWTCGMDYIKDGEDCSLPEVKDTWREIPQVCPMTEIQHPPRRCRCVGGMHVFRITPAKLD